MRKSEPLGISYFLMKSIIYKYFSIDAPARLQ